MWFSFKCSQDSCANFDVSFDGNSQTPFAESGLACVGILSKFWSNDLMLISEHSLIGVFEFSH